MPIWKKYVNFAAVGCIRCCRAARLAYILISVTNADFDSQTRNLEVKVFKTESLVKKGNSEHYSEYVYRLWHHCIGVAVSIIFGVGFALLVLTREVMRDLGVG